LAGGGGSVLRLFFSLSLSPSLSPPPPLYHTHVAGNPCNKHLLDLGKLVKKGVEDADLVGLQFNTIGVSDGTK